MQQYAIGIAVLNEIKYFLYHDEDSFIPLALDVIGAFVMDGGEYLS
jgi:hypothetical protein